MRLARRWFCLAERGGSAKQAHTLCSGSEHKFSVNRRPVNWPPAKSGVLFNEIVREGAYQLC